MLSDFLQFYIHILIRTCLTYVMWLCWLSVCKLSLILFYHFFVVFQLGIVAIEERQGTVSWWNIKGFIKKEIWEEAFSWLWNYVPHICYHWHLQIPYIRHAVLTELVKYPVAYTCKPRFFFISSSEKYTSKYLRQHCGMLSRPKWTSQPWAPSASRQLPICGVVHAPLEWQWLRTIRT